MPFVEINFGYLPYMPKDKELYEKQILIEPSGDKRMQHLMAYDLKFLDIPYVLSPKSSFLS